jgi:ABC-type glycerol-3-phosphate transport system substrate-binding protein
MEANPDMQIGLARMFNNPDAGVDNATWIGGWDIALTAGTKVPDAAFQFIQFVTTDPVGIQAFCDVGSWMPSNIRVPYFKKMGNDPKWKVFADTVVSAVKYRPAVPVLGTYTTQLGALFPQIIRRQITPNAAMEQLSKQIDIEMAEKYK